MGPQLRTRQARQAPASGLHRQQRRHQVAAQRLRRTAGAAAAVLAAGPARRLLGILRDGVLERRVLGRRGRLRLRRRRRREDALAALIIIDG
jgi:hypothetical protein